MHLMRYNNNKNNNKLVYYITEPFYFYVCLWDLFFLSLSVIYFLCWNGQKVQAFFRNASLERNGQAMDDSTVANLWSFAVAIFSAGGMIGALSVGGLVNKFGR